MSENSKSMAILNGDQVYLDELIRENARLTILHEADRMRIDELEQLAVDTTPLPAQQAAEYERRIADLKEDLEVAAATVRSLMAGADPCKVCARECKMGETCKPVWYRQPREEKRHDD